MEMFVPARSEPTLHADIDRGPATCRLVSRLGRLVHLTMSEPKSFRWWLGACQPLVQAITHIVVTHSSGSKTASEMTMEIWGGNTEPCATELISNAGLPNHDLDLHV